MELDRVAVEREKVEETHMRWLMNCLCVVATSVFSRKRKGRLRQNKFSLKNINLKLLLKLKPHKLNRDIVFLRFNFFV